MFSLFTDTGINEWVDEWHGREWHDMKWYKKREPGQELKELTEVGANRGRWKWLVKEERFEFRVKLTKREGKKNEVEWRKIDEVKADEEFSKVQERNA